MGKRSSRTFGVRRVIGLEVSESGKRQEELLMVEFGSGVVSWKKEED